MQLQYWIYSASFTSKQIKWVKIYLREPPYSWADGQCITHVWETLRKCNFLGDAKANSSPSMSICLDGQFNFTRHISTTRCCGCLPRRMQSFLVAEVVQFLISSSALSSGQNQRYKVLLLTVKSSNATLSPYLDLYPTFCQLKSL